MKLHPSLLEKPTLALVCFLWNEVTWKWLVVGMKLRIFFELGFARLAEEIQRESANTHCLPTRYCHPGFQS